MGKYKCLLVTYFISLIFNLTGNSQSLFKSAGIKFYENGQPTPDGMDVGMFPKSATRKKIDLSGYWQYTVDNQLWRNVQIPSAYDYEGVVVFQRKFEITRDMLEQYSFSLVAYGINYLSEIQINGSFVGRHIGGYSSFVFPIRENILQIGSENSIRIIVNNELDNISTIPLRHQVGGWKNYGGIFRDIYILATPKMYISETLIKAEYTPDYKNTKLKIRSTIDNSGFSLSEEEISRRVYLAFRVEIYEKFSETIVGTSFLTPVEVPTKKTKEVFIDVPISNAKFWSPESPELYIIKCSLLKVDGKDIILVDEYNLNFGIKDLIFKGSEILLNGKQLLLNGVLYNEQHLFYASALTYEEMEKDVARIKTMGANLIRFMHPPHPYFLNLCDRYGIFVLEDIPLVNVPAEILEREFFVELASTYLKDIIIRDRNNVSLLAYGLGNEIELTEKSSEIITKYLLHLKQTAKNLDNKPTYISYQLGLDVKNVIDKVDFLAVNIYPRYGESLSELKSKFSDIKHRYQNKILIVGRYGKEINPENKNGYSDPNSIESQAWYAWQLYGLIKETKFTGSVFWAYNDWLCDRPSMVTPSRNPYLKSMGTVSLDRNRRIVYDVLRNVFNNEKVTAIPVGNYSSTSPMIYVVVGLVILLSLAFIYNNNRRLRENINRSMFRTYNFFADVRDQRIIPVSHSFFLLILISMNFSLILSSLFSHFKYNMLVDNILTQFLQDSIKVYLIQLIWDPFKFIAYFTLLILLKFAAVILFIKFISLFTRINVYLYHIYSIVIWSFVPTIVLMPLAMILFRIIENPIYLFASIIFIVLILLISLFRFFRGISIIFDVVPSKVIFIGGTIIVLIVVVFFTYLDYTQSIYIYLKYFLGNQKFL